MTNSFWNQKLKLIMLLPIFAMLSGCNYFIPLAYFIGGPPSIEPDFDAMTKQSLTEKDVTVVIVAYAPPELKWDFPKIDAEVAKYVAYRLVQKKVKVFNPDKVQAWLDEHDDDWDKPEEVGAAFDATYVIHIDLGKFSLYEENSTTLYRGRSEAYISVFEMDGDGHGEKVYNKEVLSTHPIRGPRSTSEMPFTEFKREYLSRLSEEVGWLFYEHYNGDNIPYAI